MLIKVGINIILAVSLNLINGYTGQFSLGHAGFMAVGAYTRRQSRCSRGRNFWPWRLPRGSSHGRAVFLAALLAGGLVAAVAGLLVGIPSLRLKGDYLAIVTLGFGEIIRVIFRNIDSLGGALGLNGIPPYTKFFGPAALSAVTIYVVISHGAFDLRPRFSRGAG